MWATPSVITEDPEKLTALKKEFAKGLLSDPENPFAVALKMFSPNSGLAGWVSINWVNDDEVIAEKEKLLADFGDMYFLPSKAQIAREVYEIAKNDKKPTSERVAYYRLYCDITGIIERSTNINNGTINNNNGNKSMVIVQHGDDKTWEDRAAKQQEQLRQQALQDIGDD